MFRISNLKNIVAPNTAGGRAGEVFRALAGVFIVAAGLLSPGFAMAKNKKAAIEKQKPASPQKLAPGKPQQPPRPGPTGGGYGGALESSGNVKATEVKGQIRNLSMMLVLKNQKDRIEFVRMRRDYRKEILETKY